MIKLRKCAVITALFLTTSTQVLAISHNEREYKEYVKSITSDMATKDYIEVNLELTFYTDLESCNGSSSKLTASGEKLNSKTIAVPQKQGSIKPIYPFGTVIEIEGYGERIVQDTGNPKYLYIKSDDTIIVDIMVERLDGESASQYKRRVLNMGRVKSKGMVYIDE